MYLYIVLKDLQEKFSFFIKRQTEQCSTQSIHDISFDFLFKYEIQKYNY